MRRLLGRLGGWLLFGICLSVIPFSGRIWNLAGWVMAGEEVIVFEDDMVWDLDNAPVVVDRVTYHFEGDLIMEPGVALYFRNGAKIIVDGNLELRGNSDHPVGFYGMNENENFAVIARGERVIVDNALFEKGGIDNCLAWDEGSHWWSHAVADEGCVSWGALSVMDAGDLQIINTTFADNRVGLRVDSAGEVNLSNNTFKNNREALIYTGENELEAQTNCWMRPSGPTHSNNPSGRGEVIEGVVDYGNWIECGSEFQPVVLVPGIGGSFNWEKMIENAIFFEEWGFPPGVHFYDNLVQYFEDQGYEENRDFFIAYYDWRQDNHQSMEQYFKKTLEEVKKVSFDKKFNVVAHSMGGLVTLDYIFDDSYEDDIDQVVLEGTPLLGSSKVYPVWEGGEIPSDWGGVETYIKNLVFFNTTNWFVKDDYDLIHQLIPSAKQLLPLYEYLVDEETGEELDPYQMQEKNEFLDNLHNKIAMNFDHIAMENILMIEGTNKETSFAIKVKDYEGEDERLWVDGEPVTYPLERDTIEGDGTVPNVSTAGLPFIRRISMADTGHNDLPVAAIDQMSQHFGMASPVGDYPLPSHDQLMFAFACPIDVRIVAPNGQVISKDENTFPEAYYYSDGREDGFKVLEIVDPEFENYEIEIDATGNGDYRGFVYKTNGEESREAYLEGEVTEGQQISYQVELNLDSQEVTIEEEKPLDVVAPVIEMISPEEKDYLATGKLPVSWIVTDDVDSDNQIATKASLDGTVLDQNEIDLALMGLGGHSLEIQATDQAGNVAAKQVDFKLVAALSVVRENVRYYDEKDLITRRQVGLLIDNHLQIIEKLTEKRDQFLSYAQMPKKLKKQINRLYKQAIKEQFRFLVRAIDKYERYFQEGTDELLRERLEYLKNELE